MDKKILTLLNCIWFCSCAVVLQASGSLQAVTVKNCGRSILPPSSPDRIVGGSTALHGQYPFMISLKEDNRHVCGAAVLNENWVITAAHCIDYKYNPWRYEIRVGLHKLSELYHPTVQRIKISKIFVHINYRVTDDGYDIALLKTAEPIDIAGSNGYVNGICLPKDDKDPKGYATVTGWGHTTQGGVKSDVLREVTVPVVPRHICNNAYDYNPNDAYDAILPNMICAGVTGKDSCQSDSGGPLFQTNSRGETTLIGITSFGRGCGIRNYPGVYTKVSSFLKWIENTIAWN